MASDTQLRAASYCRTSGEMQRDNTSIPRQRDGNEEFIASNEWSFTRHYVDESKTGSKVEGRVEYQQMLRDAANGLFDIIVVFDIKRFGRDGADIINDSAWLRRTFDIRVVDTKNNFDMRDNRKTLTNYVWAGMSEQERLDIMERSIGGRIRRAKDGLPWCTVLPFGRSFVVTNKKPLLGHWEINEKGVALRELLVRYVNGERLIDLVKEFGFTSPTNVLANVRRSQLSGLYVAKFHAPDIDVHNLRIEVPNVPEVITPELEQRVREKMLANRKWNKEHLNKYYLSGLLRCAECERTLIGTQRGSAPDGKRYYRHNSDRKSACKIKSIPCDLIEPQVLHHLYNFFLDKPAFEASLKAALPTDEDRVALENDLRNCEAKQTKTERDISKLADAIVEGVKLELVLGKQSELLAQREALATRHADLSASLSAMPDFEQVKRQAAGIRQMLIQEHTGKNWRELPYEDVRRFLRHLFGDSCRSTGSGIFVSGAKDHIEVTFKGLLNFRYYLVDGKPRSYVVDKESYLADVLAENQNDEIESSVGNIGDVGRTAPYDSDRSL